MRLPLSLSLLLFALPASAGAQRLAYENVLEAEHIAGPRLRYAPVLDQPLRPPANVPGDDEANPVRAFYGDRLEWRPQRGGDAFNWDFSAEIGSARHRLWVAMTGDATEGSGLDYLEVSALYSRPLGDSELALQAGLRRDFVPSPRRTYGVFGVQGTIADPFYVGAFGYLSNRGEFTGRAFAYADLALTERLILQPAVETEIAAADVPALGIGAGPFYIEAGMRLRYQLHEAFAPYVGFNWERLLGRTARLAQDEGDGRDSAHLVLGLRSYF